MLESSILKSATRVEADDPRIAKYRSMRGDQGSSAHEFICDGEKVVARLLDTDSTFMIKSLYCLPQYLERYAAAILHKGIALDKIYYSSRPVMATTLGYRIHQGMMALVQKPTYLHESEMIPSILITNGVISAENMGSIVRNALAFGISNLLIDAHSCDPYLRRAVRVSMGSIFDARIARSPDLNRALGYLRESGLPIIASSARPETGSIAIQNFNFPPNFALILGNEGTGVAPEILQNCDFQIHIPMHNRVSSLNAAAASAALLMAAKLRPVENLNQKTSPTE